MDWHCLGHAMHLVEADGLRLLFDPLLDDVHHGGVFEVVPSRTIDAAALRADFIFISHRHPDHFDVKSLRTLATLDPDSVVITPDALVARVAERLGFRTVRLVPPSTRLELDTIRVVTTPSRANLAPITPEALEWGVAVTADGATVWNQVDTVFGSIDDVRATVRLFENLAVTFVPYCPLLEIEASMAGRIGFPFKAYAKLLELAATVPGVVVPSSAGARHRAPFGAMNALVYPVDEARFLRDVGLLGARTLRPGRFAVSRDGVEQVAEAPAAHRHDFKPLAIPKLEDRNLDGRDERAMRAIVDTWVRGALPAALPQSHSFLLEVVFPSGAATWSFGGDDWDVRNEVCGSMLCDVIEGKRHWGDLLLAGTLRACTRAYDVGPRGLVRAKVPELFVYSALSYAESVERAVDYELTCWAGASSAGRA